jgi:hypothetical protein
MFVAVTFVAVKLATPIVAESMLVAAMFVVVTFVAVTLDTPIVAESMLVAKTFVAVKLATPIVAASILVTLIEDADTFVATMDELVKTDAIFAFPKIVSVDPERRLLATTSTVSTLEDAISVSQEMVAPEIVPNWTWDANNSPKTVRLEAATSGPTTVPPPRGRNSSSTNPLYPRKLAICIFQLMATF